jgi:hypothetical protein
MNYPFNRLTLNVQHLTLYNQMDNSYLIFHLLYVTYLYMLLYIALQFITTNIRLDYYFQD